MLFVGTPCQVMGLKKYLSVSRLPLDNIYLCDLICHGVPSPSVWKKYITQLEKKFGKVQYLSFKDKRNGWNSPTAVCYCEDIEYSLKEYVNLFYNRCILRPSCHKCPYADISRNSDITIGDFWGIEKVMPDFYQPTGNSLLLLHTPKGIGLFDKIKFDLDYQISNETDCLQPNLIKPTEESPRRNKFWKDYKKRGLKYVIRKYTNSPLWKRILQKIKKQIIS